jgi:putative flippase GtrA
MYLSKHKKYIFAGIINTIFGYAVGVYSYEKFGENFGVIIVGIISNIISISFSFAVYKLLVFKTNNKWTLEYLKSFIVYGFVSILGILILWIFVDKLNFSIWYAQLIVIVISSFFSYIGHSFFTFINK